MTYISTKKKDVQHAENARDVYFKCLEEAYGNLPVPQDDYADITELLFESIMKQEGATEFGAREEAEEMVEKLGDAIETIREHYELVAAALGKEKRYG